MEERAYISAIEHWQLMVAVRRVFHFVMVLRIGTPLTFQIIIYLFLMFALNMNCLCSYTQTVLNKHKTNEVYPCKLYTVLL